MYKNDVMYIILPSTFGGIISVNTCISCILLQNGRGCDGAQLSQDIADHLAINFDFDSDGNTCTVSDDIEDDKCDNDDDDDDGDGDTEDNDKSTDDDDDGYSCNEENNEMVEDYDDGGISDFHFTQPNELIDVVETFLDQSTGTKTKVLVLL